MKAHDLARGVLDRFAGPGSTMQIANQMSRFVADADKFIYEGELERIWLDGDDLCARFLWIAQRNLVSGTWEMLQDPSLLDFRMSLELFMTALEPDPGRFQFLPLEPIANEQVLLIAHDYVGPTGRVPLQREEVQAAS